MKIHRTCITSNGYTFLSAKHHIFTGGTSLQSLSPTTSRYKAPTPQFLEKNTSAKLDEGELDVTFSHLYPWLHAESDLMTVNQIQKRISPRFSPCRVRRITDGHSVSRYLHDKDAIRYMIHFGTLVTGRLTSLIHHHSV